MFLKFISAETLTKQPIVSLMQSNTMIPYDARKIYGIMEMLIPFVIIQLEFIGFSHVSVLNPSPKRRQKFLYNKRDIKKL
jgi:hypothetical protein